MAEMASPVPSAPPPGRRRIRPGPTNNDIGETSVDLNKLIARVKAILLAPKTEWPVIATEPTTVADLYKGYIVWLAAIPAIFTFLGLSMLGAGSLLRLPIGTGVLMMIVSYVLSLIVCYVMALIVDALAPTFGGQRDRVQALKVVAYAYTASWIAGVGQIVPILGLLIGIAGGIYSIYLLYLGLPHTMKCPPDKAAGYTAVTIIIAIVLSLAIGAVIGSIVGTGSFLRGATYSSQQEETTFDEDSTLGKLEKRGQEVEAASKELEAAEKSGDQDAQSKAMKQMMGALAGGSVEALAPDRLKPFLPEQLGDMSRSTFSVQRNEAMGMQLSEAKAIYMNEAGRSLNLEITDTGTAKGLLALAGWSGVEGETETESGYEKTYHEDGRLIHERWDQSSSHGEYSVVLGERFTVKIEGQVESMVDLKAALAEVDLGALEELKDEGTARN
ncbi:MAG: Yip1 family protein, partial [Steroidobacteraceae bacterium]